MKSMIIFLLCCLVVLESVEASPVISFFSWFGSRAPVRKVIYATWSSAEQCIQKGHKGVCQGMNDSNICKTLRCKTQSGSVKKVGRPLDGTVCGLASVCMDGICGQVTWSPRSWGSPTAIYPC